MSGYTSNSSSGSYTTSNTYGWWGGPQDPVSGGVDVLLYDLGSRTIGELGGNGRFDGQLAYAQAVSAAFAPSASGIVVDFDEDYQPVNLVNPATAPQTYRVRTGDTLYSIAQQTGGDANLWCLIADANGTWGRDIYLQALVER